MAGTAKKRKPAASAAKEKRKVLTTQAGREHEIIREDGKYYYTSETKIHQQSAYIAKVERR